jgi:DNA-binding CsgD family transcriptional regulator/DNA-binding Xre family transcriptional regulator
MEDYRLQLKVQNGHLFRMMESRGLKTIAELARATGISQDPLGKAANLKQPVYISNGKLTATYERLCNFFYCDVSDLVPEQHIDNPLISNVTEGYATKIQLDALTVDAIDPSLMIDNDLISIDSILDNSPLNQRERDMLKMRFEDGLTYKEIGDKFGVSNNRIRQIEAKSMRKMRHPKCFPAEIRDVYIEAAGE